MNSTLQKILDNAEDNFASVLKPQYIRALRDTIRHAWEMGRTSYLDENALDAMGGPAQETLEPWQEFSFRENFSCKVCNNVPDEYGCLDHGKGCFAEESEGGGSSYVDLETMYREKQNASN